nr:MAG TPA: Neck appendage protein [Caudoviricetes sp.]
MDALTRRQFDRAMFAKDRTLAIRVGNYASRDIKEASFEYGYIKGDTYKPGGTCAGSGKITFTSIITTFNKLDILHPEIGLLVGDTYQWVKMGEYFINDIEIDRNRNTTTLELMDGMFKLNREYVTDLHFPAEVREVIQEICLKTGIELANDYFGISAMRYHVEQVPEGKKLSFRDMLSSMAQMIGMSCFFNREGKMEIRDLTESNITINADSYFLHGLTKSEIEYQIAGITCKTDKKSLTVGMKTGRSLELDNVFMTQSALNDLYYKLKNLTYYPYNLNYQGHLLLEVGQWVTIQTNKKETFKVPVLSQSFTFKGGLRGRISADSKAGNDTQYSYEGTITKQIKQKDGIEAKIQAQIEAADAAFEAEFEKRKKAIDDGIELAKAKAEEVKQELSDAINQRFDSFDNGPLKEAKRKAEEALKNAGASSLLAQEAKQIGLDSIARLEAFKSQTTTTQTALSGDLDILKRTIASDILPKQEQVTVEIAKQVEALVQTKKELVGVKSAQSTYEETTTRRLSELTNLANGKASKSELTQTAEELTSKIASLQVGGRNLYVLSKNKDISRSSHLTDLKFDISSGEISFRATGLDPYFGEAAIHPKSVSDRNGVRIPVILGKAIYVTVSNPIFIKNYISYFDKNGNTVRSYKYYKSSSFVISSKELEGANFITIRFGCGGSDFEVGSVIKTKIKVEYGTIPTDWSPAPEDIEGQISIVESNFRQRADALDAGVNRLTEGLRTKADISALNVTAENIRQSVKSLETNTQNKLDQKLSQAEFEVRAGSIRQEILNATKDKADKTLVVAEAGKLREEFSNLRVGGTNLLKGSKGPFLPDRKPANFDNNVLYAEQTSIYMEQGQEYIVSAKTDGTFTAHHDGNKESDNVVLWIMDKDVRNYQIVSDLKTGTTGTKIIWNKPTGIYHLRVNTYHKEATKSVWDVKIEKGNVATDWSPAPEDTDGLITEAKATFDRTAQGLRTDLSAIQEYVNKDGQRQDALQRYTREESAKQATAVRELVNRDFVGKSTYQEDVRGLERRFEAITNPKNGSIATQIANYKTAVDGRFADISSLLSGKANQSDFQRVKETSQLYERILGNTENGIADKVARMAMTNQLFQVEVSKNENLKTVQTQLAGSWAVQNINSAGDIISGINLGANGHNRITGKLTHITGETLIDNAVIKSAMVDKLKTANFEAGSVTTKILDAEAVTADKVRFDDAFIRKMIANEAFINQLTSKRIFATKVESVVSSSTFLEAYQGRIGGFTIGRFDQGRGRWISGINQFSVGMGNGEGGSYNGENTAFWANWGYSWDYPGPNAWYVTTSGNMYCRNGADFHGKVDFSNRSTVNFYSQPSFSNGAVINGSLRVSGRITYSGGEWLYSSIYNKLWKDNSQGGEWLYLDRQGNSGRDWIEMNKRISDRRYKSNIQDSQVSGLDVIEKLKTYSYRKEYDGKVEDISCGIMAQDVQKYAPEAFFENPDGAYSYRTFELVPYLIKAIQELNQKIEKMEKTIA